MAAPSEPTRFGRRYEPLTDRMESYSETADYTFQGKTYLVTITALYPYKDYKNGGDELRCHVDFHNLTDNVSGRFEDVVVPARAANAHPTHGHLRRFSTYVFLNQALASGSPVPVQSPIYPIE